MVFDLGGVVVELDFRTFVDKVLSKSPYYNDQKDSLFLKAFWKEVEIFDKGLISEEEFYRLACKKLNVSNISEIEFYKAFNSVMTQGNQEVIDVIKKLRALNRFKIIALSNVNKTHIDHALQKKEFLVFLKLFDELIFSYEIHMIKPEPEIFLYTIKKAQCRPEEIVFIDDNLSNVNPARKLGISGIHFTNIKNLIEELKKLGIPLG
jgi:putative hydrolase of the HAD superfamily